MKSFQRLSVLLLVLAAGCQSFSGGSFLALEGTAWKWPSFDFGRMEFRSQDPTAADDDFETKVDTRFIGKYTTVSGLNMVTLEGVGLVVGLNGTGGDPPPSAYRTALLNDMRKRKVRNPNQILRSPNTALVVVRAYLPPLIRKGDRFDVEVRLPGGSEATSLNGGWLLETHLSERAIVPGRGVMKGHVFAKAGGPILIAATDDSDDSLAGVLRRGRILGGGVSLKERDLFLDLRSDFRGYRNVKRIARRIGDRFYSYNRHGLREKLATAKTDQRIVLKVHPRYRDNYPRYLQVIRSIDFRETPVKRRVRVRKLKGELHNPQTAERAALQLEAIGPEAIPVLKTGLKSRDPEVRFHSAVALAYLNETAGLKILAEAARTEPAFRIFALAAMATVDDAETHALLRDLLHERSAETRYGAFRALTTLDKNDPFVRGENLNDQFRLHVIDTTGPPLVHLTLRKKAEVVLFGADQRLNTPVALRAGRHILITAAPRSDRVVVSRFEPGKKDRRKVVSTRLADVIRAVADLGATYPEVAQFLSEADRLGNLPGRIAIDALPEAGRIYYRRTAREGVQRKRRIGRDSFTPNLFAGAGIRQDRRHREETEGESSAAGTASLADLPTNERSSPETAPSSGKPAPTGTSDSPKIKPGTETNRRKPAAGPSRFWNWFGWNPFAASQ